MPNAAGADRKGTVRGRGLPPSVWLLRLIAKVYLAVFKRLRIIGEQRIPRSGPVILVANHTTSYDPVCLQVASKHRLIRFLQAREYYEERPVHYLYKWLQVIPVNRTGNDTASIRASLRVLADQGCLGLFPEGKMSEDGQLHEGRKGVAFLALKSGAVVIPAYLQGTRPFRGIVGDYLQFNRVTLHFGEAIRFDDLAGRYRDEAALEVALERTMAGIQELRDRHATRSPMPAA